MAKVIGKDEAAVKRITCQECAAVVEYTPGEVRTLWSGTDYGGGSDGAKGFTCPGCGKNIITERW
jgi:hypothetical protein